MLIRSDTPSGGPGILSEQARILGAAKCLLLAWRDKPHVLYNVWLLGEREFIHRIRPLETPESLNAGFTDAQYGAVFELIDLYIREAAKAGAKWRKRRDWRS